MAHKVAIVQAEVVEAVDQIARELREAHREAEATLSQVDGNTGHVAYRIRAGEAQGMRSALATLEAFLQISRMAKDALDFVDMHPLPLIG